MEGSGRRRQVTIKEKKKKKKKEGKKALRKRLRGPVSEGYAREELP